MTISEGLLVQRRLHQIHEQSVYQRRCQRSVSSCKDDDGVKWYIPHHGVTQKNTRQESYLTAQ